MTEWQPIETAPKDGTQIILFGGGLKRPHLGHWVDREVFEFGKSVRRIQQWWASDMFVMHLDEFHPTHWMPLPVAPQL